MLQEKRAGQDPSIGRLGLRGRSSRKREILRTKAVRWSRLGRISLEWREFAKLLDCLFIYTIDTINFSFFLFFFDLFLHSARINVVSLKKLEQFNVPRKTALFIPIACATVKKNPTLPKNAIPRKTVNINGSKLSGAR